MASEHEFRQIFKNILVSLHENFDQEFDQMKLYKNVGRLERKMTKTMEKFDKKSYNHEKLNSYLDHCIKMFEQQQQKQQQQSQSSDIIDDETKKKLQQLIMDQNEIEKINEKSWETERNRMIISEEVNDTKAGLEYFRENQHHLIEYQAKLKELENKIN